MEYISYDEMYKTELHKLLKERINAGIFVDIREDTLFVRLKNDDRLWECAIGNITKIMLYGISLSRLADKVVENYRKEILSRYFFKLKR